MGNMAADNAAGKRINSLLDAGSFVEIGGAVTARTTDFNIRIQPGRYCFKWCDR